MSLYGGSYRSDNGHSTGSDPASAAAETANYAEAMAFTVTAFVAYTNSVKADYSNYFQMVIIYNQQFKKSDFLLQKHLANIFGFDNQQKLRKTMLNEYVRRRTKIQNHLMLRHPSHLTGEQHGPQR